MYFTMEQDRRIHNRIRFRDIDSNVCGEFLPEEFEQIQETTVLFMQGKHDSIYPDVIDSPVFMVSDELKQLLVAYDSEVIYRRVVLNQVNEGIQKKYWLVLTEKIDGLDASSEFYPNGGDKRIVLNREKIGTRKVFKVLGMHTPKLFVHVDVSESILRRTFQGISFQAAEIR